ncbi:hypothetical protein BH11MYX4_BH11MYX4_04570 [soil metagenome]
MKAVPLHLLAGVLVLAPACTVKEVNLGVDEAPRIDAAPPPIDATQDVSDAGTTTLEARLRASCNQPTGQPDRYGSALALTQRLVGRWYLCDDPALSPVGDTGAVELRPDGQWTALGFDAAREALAPSRDPDEQGTFEYAEAAIGPDGGDAGPKAVSRDDPTTRGGLFVTLHRGVSTDIVVVADFETGPRRMLLRNAGPSKNSAFYVAIP